MKFGNNVMVKKTVEYLEKKISKLLDFDQNKSLFIERQSPFTELVLHLRSEEDLISGVQLETLINTIEQKVEIEKKRSIAAREAKTVRTEYKTELEIVQLDKCFEEALAEVAPGKDLGGLSSLEYCTMCIYYDS